MLFYITFKWHSWQGNNIGYKFKLDGSVTTNIICWDILWLKKKKKTLHVYKENIKYIILLGTWAKC